MAPLSASVYARKKKDKRASGKPVAKKRPGPKSKGAPKEAADAAPAGQKRKRPTEIVPSASKRARKAGGRGEDASSILEKKQRVAKKRDQAAKSEEKKVRAAKKEDQTVAASEKNKVKVSVSSALQRGKKPARAGKTADVESARSKGKGTGLGEDGKSAAGQGVKRRPGRPEQSKGGDEPNGGEEVAVKRGRGRPKKSKETEEESGAQETAVKRGRGRPKGSKNKDKGSNAQERAVKRNRGQPDKSKKPDKPSGSQEAVKRGRGRPKKAEAEENAGSDPKGKSGQKGGAKKAPPPRAKYLDRLEFDGTLFEAGDFVYIKKTDGDKEESDEELEECRVCGNCPQEGEDMLECDTCLGGFHLGCLDPPLEEVPEGDWNCPACCGAECGDWVTRTRQRRRTLRERYLAGELYMARINMMWQEPNGDYYFRGNWLDIPEETHMGRREHNHRREVFLSTLEDDVSMDSIIRHAWVYPRERFEQAANEGDDVYLLEYGYCPRTQRYKRIDDIVDDGRGWNYEVSDEDGDFRPSKDEGGSADEEFSAEEEEENGGKEGPRRRRAAGTKRKRKERTEPTSRTQNARRQRLEALAQLGAKEIPAAARKRKLTRLEAAQEALTLAALPKKLSCRDKERQQVTSFVEEAVSAGADCLGSCLYISGVPGTGKTATVLEVMRGLRRKVEAKELPPFQFVEINALRVPSPAHVYTALHEALTGEHLGPKAALERLQQRFEGAPRGRPGLVRRPLVVLVDELDLLVTRNQSVLYNIFDWPTLPHSQLIVIGIANTIDLPERMLPRIASRMGLRRVAFNPYTREQLQEIVADRLTGIPAFRSEAIELASRKVASASGDVRRALELCRRAAELAAARQKEAQTLAADVTATSGPSPGSGSGSGAGPSSAGKETEDVLVELGDVDAAVREMFDSPHIKSIERLSRHEQILLLALVMISRRTGIAETTFETVAGAHIDMCRSHGELPPSHANLAEIVSRLGSSHVLICEPGHRHRLRKIELNVPSDDVTFALKRNAQVTWLQKLAEQRS